MRLILATVWALALAGCNQPVVEAPAVADVREQLDRLVYPGFLTGVGAARLDDVA